VLKKTAILVFGIVFVAVLSFGPACSTAKQAAPHPKGHLLIIGGGERTAAIMKRFLDLAAGFGKGKIVVFTMATGVPEEVRQETLAEYKGLGVEDVAIYHLTRDEAVKPDAARILDGAGGVFFTGGDQSRLTAVLLDTPILARLHEMYEQGCVISGTSAGAAVMSEVMITGDEKRTKNEDELWQTIEADNVVRVRGFGLVKNAIIDQHFLARRRQNRLVSLVLENPALLGAGIDESTAILVRPDGKWEILGESQVYVVDVRKAVVSKASSNKLGAHGLALHLLLPGDVFDPVTGRAEEPSK
jgi:cyanophycinase